WLLILAMLYDRDNTLTELKQNWRLYLITTGTNFVFWLAYGISTPALKHFFPDAEGSVLVRKIGVAFVKFPNIFDKFIFEYIAAIPVTTLLIGSALVIATIYILAFGSNSDSRDKRLILFVTIVLILGVSSVNTLYTSTRYSFFIYPLFLLIAVSTLHKAVTTLKINTLSHQSLFGIALIGLMVLSEDWNTGHLYNIKSYEVNFRQNLSDGLMSHLYPRRDVRSAADYVNKTKRLNDQVIITDVSISPYLDSLNYFYRSYLNLEFNSVSCQQGALERWTNAPLLYKEKDLLDVISENKGTIWLIVSAVSNSKFEVSIRDRFSKHAVFNTPDKRFTVYKL
ncbi:MAG: hypothetical protein ACC707_01000, partial [Thiohalomonadales bacterium]